MLADDGAVESVGLRRCGCASGAWAKGAIHISSSTISVALSEKMTAAHAASGQRFVSAPVFGRPEAAAAAKLFVAAAGAPDAVDACMPLFEAIGQKNFSLRRESARRQSGQAQRQFPDFLGDRGTG